MTNGTMIMRVSTARDPQMHTSMVTGHVVGWLLLQRSSGTVFSCSIPIHQNMSLGRTKGKPVTATAHKRPRVM